MPGPTARPGPLVRSVAWMIVGTVFNQGSTLASNLAIANLVGRTSFGEYALVLTTVQAAAGFASLGLGYTATRYLAEWRHRDVERTGRLLGLFSRISWAAAVVAALVLGVSASGLAGPVFRAPGLHAALVIAAATALFSVRNAFLTGALSGLEAFRRLGLAGVAAGTGYLGLTTYGAWTGGVEGAVAGLMAATALQTLLLTWALHVERRRQAIPKAAAPIREEGRILLHFALPGALSGLTSIPALWGVQALLARSPRGFGDVAVYAACLNLLTAVLFVPTIVNGVTMPWINRRNALEGDRGYRHALRTNLVATTVILALALAATGLLGRWLLGLYGSGFRGGYDVLILLLLAGVPEALTIALNQGLQVRERMWSALAAVNVPRDAVILIAAALLVPRIGALGAAAAYLAGRSVGLAAITLRVRHDLVRLP